MVDKGTDEQISLYRGDETAIFSPALVHHLNELSDRLLQLSGPSDLYTEASGCLAEMFDALVAVVRLPSDSQPLPESPDVLTLHLPNAEKGLQAGRHGESVRIDITDTGIGIPAEELEQVFDEFFRASNATKGKQEGSGPGLSIVKQIVESHGGTISVQSDEGGGSTFTILLPQRMG